MTKIAIQHMTEEQANAEAARIDEQLYELQQKMWVLDAKAERMRLFSTGWLKRMNRIGERLREISGGAAAAPREANCLIADLKKIMDRQHHWAKASWAVISVDREAIGDEMQTLYRRSKLVNSRRWQHNYARLGKPVEGEIRVLR